MRVLGILAVIIIFLIWLILAIIGGILTIPEWIIMFPLYKLLTGKNYTRLVKYILLKYVTDNVDMADDCLSFSLVPSMLFVWSIFDIDN